MLYISTSARVSEQLELKSLEAGSSSLVNTRALLDILSAGAERRRVSPYGVEYSTSVTSAGLLDSIGVQCSVRPRSGRTSLCGTGVTKDILG